MTINAYRGLWVPVMYIMAGIIFISACSVTITAKELDKKQFISPIRHIPELDGVPLPMNDDVLKMIKFFQTERREPILKALSLMDRYLEDFKRIFREEGIPEVIAYLPFIESAYDPLARSNVGARGIWQFMPSTGRMFGLKINSWIDERAHPEKSCRAAARYLNQYYKKFGSWTLAIAAYNAGPTRINRAVRRLGTSDFWRIKKSRYIRGQTKRYIPAFIAGVHIARNPHFYGFLYTKKPLPESETVTIEGPADLSIIAKCAETDVKTIREMNPELRRSITPYSHKTYEINIPKNSKEKFLKAFAEIPEEKRIVKTYYKIRRGDTLSHIARKFGTSVRELMSANNLRSTRHLRIGRTLVVPLIPGYSSYKYAESSYRGGTPSKYKRGQKLTHRVRRGDSLYKIARRYRTDIKSLCEWNNISASGTLHPGKKLVVYYRTRSGKEPLSEGKHVVYTVRYGDSLYSIARAYNTTVRSLRKLNNIRHSKIYPGDTLLIPAN